MRMFVLMSLFVITAGCNASSEATKKSQPWDQLGVKEDVSKAKTVPNTAEEDCDDKAKKPIEIKEETISLSGNTGCSLDEAKP